MKHVRFGLILIIAFCVLILSVTIASATEPYVAWSKQYNGTGLASNLATSVCMTPDGNFIIVGAAQIDDNYPDLRFLASEHIYVAAIAANGSGFWYQLYGLINASGGEVYEPGHANAIAPTRDGGYIITGQSGQDLCLLKISGNGDPTPLWFNVYPGLGVSEGYSVQQASDGGFIVTGNDVTNSGNGTDLYLVKVDTNGILQWSRHFGGAGDEFGRSVKQASDGGFIVAGDEDSYTKDHSIFLLKTDLNGNETWGRSYGGRDFARGYDVLQTPDGGYTILGTVLLSTGHPYYDILMHTSATGNMQWINNYTIDHVGEARSLAQASDGGYVLGGWSQASGDGPVGMCVIRTDSNGDLLWYRSADTQTFDESEVHGVMTGDGSYIMAGFTVNGDPHNADRALVVKFSDVESAQRENDATPVPPRPTAHNTTVIPDSTMVIETPGMEWWLALAAMLGAVLGMACRRR